MLKLLYIWGIISSDQTGVRSSRNASVLVIYQRLGMHVRRFHMAKNTKQTSKKAASAASKVLRDGRTGKASKTAAGSALSQAPRRKK